MLSVTPVTELSSRRPTPVDVAGSGLAAVFIPNSPNMFSGSDFFLAADKVRPLDVRLGSALNGLEQCGAGGRSFLSDLSLVDPRLA
jgi:hypothetical protein